MKPDPVDHVDPVDLIATPAGVLAWYRCDGCGTCVQRDRRLPLGAMCEGCGGLLTASSQFQHAPLRRRLFALAIDTVLLLVPYFILGLDYAMWGIGRVDPDASQSDHDRVRVLTFALLFGVLLVYQLAGSSPGKLAMSIRIVDAKTWKRPGVLTAIVRTGAIFATMLTLGIGYLNMLTDEKRRTLHDLVAGTLVIER